MAAMRHQASGRRLAEMAQKEGFALASTTFNHIRAGRYKSTPTDETIRAIGWLAGVGDEVAFAAAGRKAPGLPLADELPPGADRLSPKARKTIIDLTRVLIEYESDIDHAQEQHTNHDTPTPLRAVASPSDPRSGQKTPADSGVIELHGEEARNIPVPPREQLAAHPKVKTKREQLAEETGEIEEDPEADNW